MTKKNTENTINLYLQITKNPDNTYHYQYMSITENGILVDLQGVVISQATTITVQLIGANQSNYRISDCLIPCDQNTLTAKIDRQKDFVTIIDKDNEKEPTDYYFVIIVQNRHSYEYIICDPEIRNRGKL